MGKELTFKKVIETQKELIYTEGFDRLESTELAIDKRKFVRNRLYEKQPISQDADKTYWNVTEFFFLDLCIVAFLLKKNCKQPKFTCVLLITSQSLHPFVYTG